MKQDEQSIKSYLQRISNILLINGSFLDNVGLYTGKMSLVIFFAHYARYKQNELYLDYSFNLIDKVKNIIHKHMPISYKHGLAGIGCTIEYLVQNDFFEADTDDILEEFDRLIFFTYNLSYLSIGEIMSIGYYALWRLSGNSSKKDIILQIILPQTVNIMDEWFSKRNLTYPIVFFLNDIVISSKNHDILPDHSYIPAWLQLCRRNLPDKLAKKKYNHISNFTSINDSLRNKNINFGYEDGLAGLGLSLLTELDGNDSWISLFPNDFIFSKK
jgi:hypothetical protein